MRDTMALQLDPRDLEVDPDLLVSTPRQSRLQIEPASDDPQSRKSSVDDGSLYPSAAAAAAAESGDVRPTGDDANAAIGTTLPPLGLDRTAASVTGNDGILAEDPNAGASHYRSMNDDVDQHPVDARATDVEHEESSPVCSWFVDGHPRQLRRQGTEDSSCSSSIDDLTTRHTTRLATSSSVKSLMVTIVDNDDHESSTATPDNNCADYGKLMCCSYCVLMTLLGILVPLAEALSDEWLQAVYSAVYNVYMLIVSIACVMYLQILVAYESRRQKKEAAAVAAAASASPGNVGVSRPRERRGSLSVKFARTRTEIQAERNCEDDSSTTKNHIGAQDGVARFAGKLSRMISYDSAVFADSQSQLGASGVSECGDINDAERDIETEQVWMDTANFANIFSHEGSSLYLRLWELVFALGNAVYIAMEIQYHMRYTTEDCTKTHGWLFVIRIVFLITQTYFLFKNPTMHVKRHPTAVRFALMHLIATNMSVWLRTLVHETMNEYVKLSQHSNQTDDCTQYRIVVIATSPYLFPFMLEYSLIAMGALAAMFLAVDHQMRSSEDEDTVRGFENYFRIRLAVEKSKTTKNGQQSTQNSGDSSSPLLLKSHRGLFLNFLMLAGAFVGIIVFYFWPKETRPNVYLVTDVSLHGLMLIATPFAMWKFRRLSYLPCPVSVDDVLLLVAASCAVFYELALMMTAGHYMTDHRGHHESATENSTSEEPEPIDPILASHSTGPRSTTTEILRLSSSIVSALQTFLQMLLTIDGMRRYPSTQKQLEQMPGRGTIIFLMFANVTVWIERTALLREMTPMVEYFGTMAWLLIVNINLPLSLFFRFHSSICLAEVWQSAYTLPKGVQRLNDQLKRSSSTSPPNGRQLLNSSSTSGSRPNLASRSTSVIDVSRCRCENCSQQTTADNTHSADQQSASAADNKCRREMQIQSIVGQHISVD